MDDRKRLEQVLAAYGADPDRWPEADRKLAPFLADTDLTAAREIDAALAAASRPVASSGSLDRLKASLPASGIVVPMTPRAARPKFQALWVGGALAASLALGIYLGGSGVADDFAASADAPLDLIGLGDAEAIAEEDAA